MSAMRNSIWGGPLIPLLALCGAAIPGAMAQTPSDSPEPVIASSAHAEPISDDRILGLIPNFQTISDPSQAVKPLTAKQKWQLFIKETADPFTFVSAAMAAGISQSGNDTPKYGVGAGPYGQRVGAAYADLATQNFFSDALLAPIFHQDPRYYRMGPGRSVMRRTFYSMSRLFVTRQDSGQAAFNISGVLGMGMGIALSNAYYPSSNVNGSVVGSRFVSSIVGASFGNLLPEFWPDVKRALAQRRH